MRAIVVGAGVIGASVAHHLARAGVEVTVLDGGAAAASPASFGWINASFYQDPAHHRLRAEGIAAYGRLLAALPNLPVTMGGAVWWEEQGEGLAAFETELEGLGYPVKRLDRAAVARIAPGVADLPDAALHFPSEGWAETAALKEALLKGPGIRVMRGVRVTGLTEEGGVTTGVLTNLGMIPARHVVVAAGNGAPAILDSVGVALPMLKRPGVMVTTEPVDAQIGSVLVTPEGEVRQSQDGRILSPAAANHQGDTSEAITEDLDAIAARTCARLATLLGLSRLDWESVAVADRPVPQDGLPVIGAAGPRGLHVAVMHSGVTLAAITGEVIAAEVLGQVSNAQRDLIAPYGAGRFQ